jgi:hypothetical protein
MRDAWRLKKAKATEQGDEIRPAKLFATRSLPRK